MITLLAVVSVLTAQSPQQAKHVDDSVRIERLTTLGRLWYAARLFHPYLAYRPIDWDSALVAAIPRVSAARTADAYAAAVQGMLDALGDPATHVERPQTAGQVSSGDPDPHARWTDDSVLVISASNYADLDDWNRGIARCDSLAALVPHARAVVFDFRQRVPGSGNGLLYFVLSQSKLLPELFAAPLAAPGTRTRMHQGYRSDTETGSGYWSAWVTQDGDVFSGPATVWRPAAFVVNDRSDVPGAALALQAAGRAGLVVEGAGTDASLVSTTQLQIGDELTVRLRLSEMVFADGTGGLPADTVVGISGAAGTDPSLEAALAMVRRPAVAHHARPALEPRAAPPPQRDYAGMTYPSLPYRLLAAFRVWGTFEYFHAYKQLYDEDWSAVLKTFIPKLEGARDSLEYALALAEMVSHTRDNHVWVRSPVLAAYWGEAQTPLLVRIIQGVPVVTGFTNDSVARATGVRIGDVIERVDGEPVAARLARRERYLTASTPQWLHWSAVRSLLAGSEGSTAVLRIRGATGGGGSREVRLSRRKAYQPSCYSCRTGPMLRMLPGNVGYADLDRLPASSVDSMFELFRGTRAIIFDMRGYPQGTAWPIAPRLTERSGVVAARFQNPVATNPLGMSLEQVGEQEMTFTFEQRLDPTTKSRYRGRTVMLIDERTISQAEHTGLFFEAANGTKFVGSATSGANGDVTSFVVPGGISISFSGHDVRHADGRQLQRVGLRPDVLARPTIAGIRAGRDEVLDAALAYLRRPRAARSH